MQDGVDESSRSLQRLLHKQTDAEARVLCAENMKPTSNVEMLRMWISHNMKMGCSGSTCGYSAMLYQHTANASKPARWLYKEGIELGVSICSRKDRCKPTDHACSLCDEHTAINDLLEW